MSLPPNTPWCLRKSLCSLISCSRESCSHHGRYCHPLQGQTRRKRCIFLHNVSEKTPEECQACPRFTHYKFISEENDVYFSIMSRRNNFSGVSSLAPTASPRRRNASLVLVSPTTSLDQKKSVLVSSLCLRENSFHRWSLLSSTASPHQRNAALFAFYIPVKSISTIWGVLRGNAWEE